jgi:D-lactate dehydrogenase (cytochrome)
MDRPHACYVLCEVSSSRNDPTLREVVEQTLGDALERGLAIDAVLAESLMQRESLWKLRESIPEGQRHEGASIKHDVSVPVAALPDFLAQASAAVARLVPAGRLVAYGHVGDGNLHFNLSQPPGADAWAFLEQAPQVHAAVYELVERFRGSISAEHGIGRLKRDELGRFEPAVALDLMRSIKRALDPRGIMNPGKVLPPFDTI